MAIASNTIVEFKLEGFKEAREELLALSKNLQRKGAHAMASEGAAVVRKAAIPKVYKASTQYFSYVKEALGEYANMTVHGRNKKGMIRQQFEPGWVAKNIFMGKSKKSRSGNAIWRVFLAPQAWFGVFVEYGSAPHGIPAKPFLRPAVKENIPKIIDAMRGALFNFLNDQYYKYIQVKRYTW